MGQAGFDKIPLEWIRAFEAAARCGSFTAAAEETGVTQSAVSQRIDKLEKHLGALLFLRQARSIALTVEGEAWLPHVRSAFDSLRESSEGLFGGGAKRLTLSASSTIIDRWIVPRLDQLKAGTDSQFSLQTMVLATDASQEDDLVRIRYGSGSWPVPYKAALFGEQITPVASPGLLRSTSSWMELPRIALSGPRPGWTDWCARFGTPTTPLPMLRFDSLVSALAAARAGHGVLLASLPLCSEELASGALQRATTETFDHHETYWLLASKEAVSRQQWGLLETVLRQPSA